MGVSKSVDCVVTLLIRANPKNVRLVYHWIKLEQEYRIAGAVDPVLAYYLKYLLL